MQYLGGCEEAAKHFGFEQSCCDSCHNDADEGYCSLIEIEIDQGYFNVCCYMHIKYEATHGFYEEKENA